MPALPSSQFEKISGIAAVKLVRHSKWAKLYISEFNSLPTPWDNPDNRIARISFREHMTPGDTIEDMLNSIPILRAIGFTIVMLSETADCPFELMLADYPNPNKLPPTDRYVEIKIWKDEVKAIHEYVPDSIPLTAYDATVAVPNDCFDYIMDILNTCNDDVFEINIEECNWKYIDFVSTISKLMILGLYIPIIDVHPDCTSIVSFAVSTVPTWKKLYTI